MRNLTVEIDHTTPFDFIFILGPDINDDPIIKKFTELKNAGKKVAIITTSSDYGMIENAIGPRTRIDIDAHGARGTDEKKHFVKIPLLPLLSESVLTQDKFTSTDLLFTYITQHFAKNKNLNGLQVHVWSCFGGRAIHAVEHLPVGSTLITHGPENTFTFYHIIYNDMLAGITRNCFDPMVEFAHILCESPEETAIARLTEKSLFMYRALLPETVFNSPHGIRSHIDQKLLDYYAALKTFDVSFISLELDTLEINITEQQLELYGVVTAYLHTSTDNNAAYIKTYLEQRGIHPSNFSLDGENLPYIAAQRMARNDNVPELWNYLIENKVDLNMSAGAGSPATVFISQDKLDGINFLLSQNIDVNYRTRLGGTLLIFAAHKKRVDVVKRLLQEKNILIDAQDNEGFSALMLAAYVGDLAIVNILLQAGADPILRSKTGVTALFFAAQNGFSPVVKRLLRHNSVIAMIISNLLQKAGCSEQSAKISGNTAAFFVNTGLEMMRIGVVAALVNYSAGRVGLFLEKKGINKLRGLTEDVAKKAALTH
ncbi:MAG: hypothetical protein A3I77_03205 [Gammaproteobacteria bacterium RIFCSPLOWO2_02_FULL_42_14]|nr:MAG: hypothetical protein A3B71_01185 [Gammaproteobacteria bacterium RIFCSPHIGHO2_02_FULL_42_43]OGT28807.1 MAG: hypothetical protein A2624_01475 [Gammaproteobacteria bacterium RIFCSPHIGHO2_01_FULL_42_8]OGT51680.1 MAG: hypothetical protein A3E54_03400 [Gammaproteobacteria bacterium RIFCSPHIGHO2_12_FULL_41_25]OGT61578.1 MAG: hypothetical protein A3I77_03205 [Gammaproteobacteria bacterium RIFCSPLOWO2_02_FULL_42_14]OGT86201.1 MAG: hypothetical protein A3G86_06055 [Gammaproteobacteria bacterium R